MRERRIEPLALQPDLVDRAYGAILDAICDGTLAAGTRLTQEELALRLGVSRQPVMQALLLLRKQGFVCEAGRRGVMVAGLEPERVLQLYQIRGVLDGLAAQGAATLGAAEAKRRGPAIIAAGRRAVQSRAIAAMTAADMAFHQLLYALSGNPLIADALTLHWQHIRRVMGAVLRREGVALSVWDEHAAILAAVIAGNAAEAERLSRAHAEVSARALAAALTEDKTSTTADKDQRQRRTQ
jgi:DNA-binding GntR family transcriptional regulator